MAILGAHMSIAGGYYRAVEAAVEAGCDCVQLFTKNNNQWRAKAISDGEAQRFRDALRRTGISHPLAHDSYLINLAAPDDALWRRSVDALVQEMERAARLGIAWVVAHPGAYTSSSEEAGLARVVAALNQVHAATRALRVGCLLETTAGQGTSLGWRFEQLAAILDQVESSDWLGVCLDTCHMFAAGYPLASPREYRATMRLLDQIVGIARVKAIHLNDSQRECGSRVDRHAHIGHGQLGLEPFRHLLNDRRFAQVPMYLETPKGRYRGRDWDVVNLQTLRSLLR